MVENQVDWRQRWRAKQDTPVEPKTTGKPETLAEHLGIKIDPKPEPPIAEQAGTDDQVKVGVQRPVPQPEPVPEPVVEPAGPNPTDEPVAPEDTAEEPTVDPLTGTPIQE